MKIQFFIQYISFRKVIFGAFRIKNKGKYIAGYRVSKFLLDSVHFDIEFKYFSKSFKGKVKKIENSIIEKIIEFSKNLNGEEVYKEYLIEI